MTDGEFERLLKVLRDVELRLSAQITMLDARLKSVEMRSTKMGAVATTVGIGIGSAIMYMVEHGLAR